MEVTFDFWTNLCSCGGGNIGGSCTMEMSDEEVQLFKEVNAQAEDDEADNIIDYFKDNMPGELYERIDYAIFKAFERQETESAIRSYGLDCFKNMSAEEFEKLSMEELIDRCLEDNCDGVCDFYIVKICVE